MRGLARLGLAALVLCVTAPAAAAASTAAVPLDWATPYTVEGALAPGLRHVFLWDVVCLPATTRCLAVGNSRSDGPEIFVSADPRAPGRPWTATKLGPSNWVVTSLACPSASFCVAYGYQNTSTGETFGTPVAWTSSDPTGPTQAWIPEALDGAATDSTYNMLSCPTAQLCAAITFNGLLVSTNPAGGAGAWTLTATPDTFSVDCPSTALCVAVGDDGITTSTDPADPAAWRTARGRVLRSLACPTPSFCVTASDPQLLASSDPANPDSWHAVPAPSDVGVDALACAAPDLCAGASQIGFTYSSAQPGTRWNAPPPPYRRDGAMITGMACPSRTLCVAVDSSGRALVGTAAATLSAPSHATVAQLRRGVTIDLTGLQAASRATVTMVARSATFASATSRAGADGKLTLKLRLSHRAKRKYGTVKTPPEQLLAHRTLTVAALVTSSSGLAKRLTLGLAVR
jgi:hypothetical protein